MMKRAMIFLLIGVIFITALPVAIAEDSMSQQDIERSIVSDLGFVKIRESYDEPMTRGEFATTILRLYGEETPDAFTEGIDTSFHDVNAEHYKSADIKRAVDLALLNGYGDGFFYPDQPVKLSEAVKIILDLLGYTEYVLSKGGYPAAYMQQATNMKLTKGVSKAYYEGITKGELVKIIYNAMKENIVDVSYLTNESVFYAAQEGVTFLVKYHNIYKGTGVVTANSTTAINGVTSLSDNQIMIDGNVYISEKLKFHDLLGLNIEFYYKKLSDRALLVSAVEINTEREKIAGKDILSAAGKGFTYLDKNENRRTVSFAENGNVIYNGMYLCKVVNFDFNKIVDIQGEVNIIDINRDGKFDYLFVEEYVNYIVENVINSEKVIFLKNTDDVITIDDKTACVIMKGNSEITLGELESDNLISVMMTDGFFNATGKKSVRIVVSDAFIEGKVSGISDDEIFLSYEKGEEIVEESYRISRSFISKNNSTLNTSSNGLFYIDALGELGYYKDDMTTGMQYGYIITTGHSGTLKKEYQVKMLTESNKIQIFSLNEKVKVDGENKKDSDVEGILLTSGSRNGDKRQLVRYRLNSQGLVSAIDTRNPNIDVDSKALVNYDAPSGGLTWISGQGMFLDGSVKRYFVGGEVKVFEVPSFDTEDDKDYRVTSRSSFYDNAVKGNTSSGEKLTMYNIEDAEPAVIEILTDKKRKESFGRIDKYENPLAVIKKKFGGIDDEGEEYVGLTVLVSGGERKLKIKVGETSFVRFTSNGESATGLRTDETPLTIDDYNFGDCIMYATNDKGDVETLLKVNAYNVFDACEGGPIYYGREQSNGYIERTWASVRKVSNGKLLLDISNENGDLYVKASGNVYLVDKDTKDVTTATIKDIIYSEDDSIADKVFLRVRNYQIKEIVIYR